MQTRNPTNRDGSITHRSRIRDIRLRTERTTRLRDPDTFPSGDLPRFRRFLGAKKLSRWSLVSCLFVTSLNDETSHPDSSCVSVLVHRFRLSIEPRLTRKLRDCTLCHFQIARGLAVFSISEFKVLPQAAQPPVRSSSHPLSAKVPDLNAPSSILLSSSTTFPFFSFSTSATFLLQPPQPLFLSSSSIVSSFLLHLPSLPLLFLLLLLPLFFAF